MTDLVLTVQGSARAELDPERATVRFTVAADGRDRAPVVETVTASLASVSDAVSARATDGSVETWSVDSLSVSAQRPWTNDGTQAPLVHRASASGRAVLHSPDRAAELVDTLAANPLVTIDAVEWSLTEATLAASQAEVRTRAVADARDKAIVLATAAGRSSVEAVALADPGMLDGSPAGMGPQPRFEKAMAMAMDAGGAGGFSLRPQPIVIDATIDARFVAR
ncbi:MAG: hypothetical protein RL499_1300 [Actinomycetota bacterium]|jgi:uncharacterized protein YggE